MWQGEALPVPSCSRWESSEGLQREQGCTLAAQRGRIQLEAGMSAGVNAGHGEVVALPSSACSWLCNLRQVTSPVSGTYFCSSQHRAHSLNSSGSFHAIPGHVLIAVGPILSWETPATTNCIHQECYGAETPGAGPIPWPTALRLLP